MDKQNTLCPTAGILMRQVRSISSRVSRNSNGFFSPGVRRFVGLLWSLVLLPPSFALAEPNPPTNLCIEGAADCGVVPAPPSAGAKKWHPGHYMSLTLGDSADNAQNSRFGYYDEIAGNTHIQGVVLKLKWSQLESTQGNYTFDTVQADLDYLKALSVPKRLFIRMLEREYILGGASCSVSKMFPAYLRTGANAACTETTNGNTGRIWNSFARGRLIALYEAMSAQWDDEPYFEGLHIIRETAKNGTVISDPEFSDDAYTQGLKNLADGANGAFVKSNVIMSINYAGGQSRVSDLISYIANNTDVGVGGPDILPTGVCSGKNPTHAYQAIRGIAGGVDYRGALPLLFNTEASQMGGSLGDCEPDQIRDFANDELHASHLFWTRNTFRGTPLQQWSTGILPYINDSGNDLTHTSCPSNYSQGCDAN